jgi:hypothetical protein
VAVALAFTPSDLGCSLCWLIWESEWALIGCAGQISFDLVGCLLLVSSISVSTLACVPVTS